MQKGVQFKSKNNTANSVDPDETARYEPSHLDLHCFHRYLFVYRAESSKLCLNMMSFASPGRFLRVDLYKKKIDKNTLGLFDNFPIGVLWQ